MGLNKIIVTIAMTLSLCIAPSIGSNATSLETKFIQMSERSTNLPEASKAYLLYQRLQQKSELASTLGSIFVKENGRSFEDSSGENHAKELLDWASNYPSVTSESLIELRRQYKAQPKQGSSVVKALELKYFLN